MRSALRVLDVPQFYKFGFRGLWGLGLRLYEWFLVFDVPQMKPSAYRSSGCWCMAGPQAQNREVHIV